MCREGKGGGTGRDEGGAKTERGEEGAKTPESYLTFFYTSMLILQSQSPSHLILITALII